MATILVVDDRPTNRQFLMTLLGYTAHRLLEAADGAQALEVVRRERPELVVTDILMPTMDGYEFVQRLRAIPELAATKVIFYTATYSVTEATQMARTCGVEIVLPKPSEPQVILDAVSRALGIEGPVAAIPEVERVTGAADIHDLARLGNTIADYLGDLAGAKQVLQEISARGAKLAAQRERIQEIVTRFTDNLSNLQRVTTRLAALEELGLTLIAERNPERLVATFLGAATRIVGSQISAIGMLDEREQKLSTLESRGFDAEIIRACGMDRTRLPASLLDSSKPMRWAMAEATAAKMPDGHPKAKNFLGLRVATDERVYGWLYFADKLGAKEFNEEDVRLAQGLATQLALIYENAALYHVVQHHAAQLQIEITQRRQAEERVRRLNRVYAVLSGINTLIVRVRDRGELFRESCRIAVEQGEFGMAWIGEFDPHTLDVTPVAWHGMDESAVSIKASARDDIPDGQGMVGRAIRSKSPMITNDIDADPGAGGPRRAEALRKGFHSIIAMPLIVGGEVKATLTLFARERDFFSAEEMKLLTELAGDIAFAIDNIEKRAQLDYLALYDQLTGLANRGLLCDRLNQLIHAAGRAGGKVAVAKLDLERMRMINESLGRHAGDEVHKEIAARLVRSLGGAPVGRVSANHFAIALVVKGRSEAERGVQEILRTCFETPFRADGSEFRLAAKCGIALFPNDGADAETLLSSAEVALRKAKETGERHAFYTRDMTRHTGATLTLESKLRQALEKEELVLHYQPKVDLATRHIVGVEALMRWQSAELGLVPPAKFIPLMEETGMILEAGAWALQRAARDHRGWVEQKLPAPRVAVNVSAIQLRKRDFVAAVERAIMEGVAPTGIDLEITESLLMEDVEVSIQKLKEIRNLGLSVAIDDFGTGYSSLAYLAKLPLAMLKIDRAFIVNLLDDPDTATLVQTMISLAHTLKLKVVAEGVETEEQARVLRLLTCDQMQGYLFSKPLPLEAFTALLRDGR